MAKKLKGVAQDLRRKSGSQKAGSEDSGIGSEQGQPGLVSAAQQSLEQGAMTRRAVRLGADLVRVVPVVDHVLDGVSGALDRLAQAPGVTGRVGRLLKGVDQVGEVVEKGDLGVLAARKGRDLIGQATDIGRAVQQGNHAAEATTQTRELLRNTLTVKDGAELAREVVKSVARKVVKAAPGAVRRVKVLIARTAGQTVRAASRRFAGSVAARTLGKAAGRFVPGVNVAIAVADTYLAFNTFRDPRASTWNKARTAVTALGSIAAATNIPGVSQAGAAISILGSIAPDRRPRWLGGK